MGLNETRGRSEYSQLFPKLSPLLDVWFNSTIGRDNGLQPWTIFEMIRSILWNKAEAVMGNRPIGTPRTMVEDARHMIEEVLDLASKREPSINRKHWLAAQEATKGQPLTVDYLLRGEPEGVSKRKIAATADLVYALNSHVFPKDPNTEIIINSIGIPHIVGQEPLANASDAMMRLRSGLTLLGMELTAKSR